MATELMGLLLVRVLTSSHVMNHDTECRTALYSHYIALMALNVARYTFLGLQRRYLPSCTVCVCDPIISDSMPALTMKIWEHDG